MMSRTFAPAKINLTLHVTGQRDDGYHLLDSLVAFADVGDRVRVMPADETTLEVTGPMAEGVPADETNLALRAAGLFELPVAITLDKHLPMAAGLGRVVRRRGAPGGGCCPASTRTSRDAVGCARTW